MLKLAGHDLQKLPNAYYGPSDYLTTHFSIHIWSNLRESPYLALIRGLLDLADKQQQAGLLVSEMTLFLLRIHQPDRQKNNTLFLKLISHLPRFKTSDFQLFCSGANMMVGNTFWVISLFSEQFNLKPRILGLDNFLTDGSTIMTFSDSSV